jgi:hypothetical protein
MTRPGLELEVLEERAASIFRVEEYAKPEMRKTQAASVYGAFFPFRRVLLKTHCPFVFLW